MALCKNLWVKFGKKFVNSTEQLRHILPLKFYKNATKLCAMISYAFFTLGENTHFERPNKWNRLYQGQCFNFSYLCSSSSVSKTHIETVFSPNVYVFALKMDKKLSYYVKKFLILPLFCWINFIYFDRFFNNIELWINDTCIKS